MKQISLMIFFVGFLLFRPYQMQENGLLYAGDDYSYFAHATSLVFGQFPSYQKECFPRDDGDRPMHSIGPALMALPFVFVFSQLDRLTGDSIVQQRQENNISQSWTLYGFVLASMFYLWMGCFLLYRGLRYYFEEHESVLAVFLMVICQGIPLFAYRRPLFSHIFEFFAMCVLVWWILLPRDQWPRWSQGLKGAIILGVVLGLLELVRLNDIMMILVWPLILFFGNWKKILIAYVIAGGLVLGFYVLPAYFSHSYVYGNIGKQKLLTFYPFIFYFQRLWNVLTGIDWGLIYTAPFILIGLASAVFIKYPLRRIILLSILPLAVNLYVILNWKTQGGWYGYRYFIPVAAPLVVYPLALLLSQAGKRWGRGMVLGICLIIGTVPLLSMLAFEGNSNLTLTNAMEYFGVSDWGNNTYQLNVWKTLIQHPVSLVIAVFKGGPLYCIYCLKILMGHQSGLLTRLKGQYPYFSPIVFFRTLFIYLFPFLLYLITLPCRKKICHTPSVSDI